MRTLIQQVHIYLSLLSFSSLCVFGVIGVYATMAPKWEDRPQPPAKRWEVPFAAPKDLDDEALAESVRRQFGPPLPSPAPMGVKGMAMPMAITTRVIRAISGSGLLCRKGMRAVRMM